MSSEQIAGIGRNIWWSHPDGHKPARGAWDAGLAAEGLPALPESSEEAIAGRAARRAAGRLKGWSVEPMEVPGAVRAYGLVRTRDSGAGVLAVEHTARAVFKTGKVLEFERVVGSLEDFTDAETRFQEAYQDEIQYTSVQEVSEYLRRWVATNGGVPLANGGSPFFVPVDDVGSISRALEAIGWRLGQVLVTNDSASHETVLTGATEAFIRQVDDVSQAIDSTLEGMDGDNAKTRIKKLDRLTKQAVDLSKQVSGYEARLASTMTEVSSRLSKAMCLAGVLQVSSSGAEHV
jgi:hypothetical protein